MTDRKSVDLLPEAVHRALDSSLLSDLSAIVVAYARSPFVDWNCETRLDSQLIGKRLAIDAPKPLGPMWEKTSDDPSKPPLTVTLPATGDFVWLCGCRPFSDPAAVRRWSVAVLNPENWFLYFGLTSRDSKAAAQLTSELAGALTIECPSAVLYDGDKRHDERRLHGRRADGGFGLQFVLTFEVDLVRKTMAVQAVEPPDSHPSEGLHCRSGCAGTQWAAGRLVDLGGTD